MDGPPPTCDDHGCGVGFCNYTADACSASPNDTACPDGDVCGLGRCAPETWECDIVPVDAQCDDMIACTRDQGLGSGRCEYEEDDGLCDDSCACTTDSCNATAGGCVNEPIPGWCVRCRRR